MSRLFRNLTVAAAATTIALAAGPQAASAATPATTTNPATAAAGWLAQQLVDGDHLVYSFDGKTFDGGGTADLIYALAAAKAGKSSIDRAISYFKKNVETYVDIRNTDGYGPNDGGIGKTVIAAMVAGADPTSFGGYNLLQQLKTDECTAASSSCPAKGAAANIYSSISQSLVVTAEARGTSIDAKYAPSSDAIDYLLSLQCSNGGFTSGTAGGAGCTSDPDATGYALMALQAVGGHAAALTKGGDWLQSTVNKDGSWTSQGGRNVDSTGLGAAGLAAAGRSASASRAWLVSQQVTNGPTVGKGAQRGALKYQGKFDASSSVKGTSDGMLGLVAGTSLATLDDSGASADAPVLALAAPTLSHHKVHAGSAQKVTGTGFAAGESVRASVHSKPVVVGVATADKSGTVRFVFTVPKSLASGHHTLELTGGTSHLQSQTSFVVTTTHDQPGTIGTTTPAPTPSSAQPGLADTGRPVRQTHDELVLGVSCVALGGVALLLGRRRKHSR